MTSKPIAFGLLVFIMCGTVRAHFKAPIKDLTIRHQQHPIPHQQHPIPSTSGVINPHRQAPRLTSTSLESFKSVNLGSSSHSLMDSHRSISTPMLNNELSSAILHEVESTHSRAAASLNIERFNIEQTQQRSSLLQRLRPNPERINTYVKYLKNTAIGAAGIGGVIIISDFVSNRNGGEHIAYDTNSSTTTSTTANPEHYNPIGNDD